MCKDVGYATANCNRGCKFAKIRGVLVSIDGAVFIAKYL